MYKKWKTLSAQTAISMYTTAISNSKPHSKIQGSISEKYKLLTTLSIQTDISMDTTTAIPESKTDPEQQSLKCFCPCNLRKWTVSDKEEIIRHFKDILHVDKRKTSNFLRRKTSAPDDRISAKSVGFVGIIFLVLPFALIVIFDCCGRRIPN